RKNLCDIVNCRCCTRATVPSVLSCAAKLSSLGEPNRRARSTPLCRPPAGIPDPQLRRWPRSFPRVPQSSATTRCITSRPSNARPTHRIGGLVAVAEAAAPGQLLGPPPASGSSSATTETLIFTAAAPQRKLLLHRPETSRCLARTLEPDQGQTIAGTCAAS